MAVVAAALAFAPGAASAIVYPGDGSWQPGPARYGQGVLKDQTITMDDGVKLSADIHYPTEASGAEASGRFPVLLAIEPYAKDGPLGGGVESTGNFVPYGYIYVVVDVRGTGSSQGSFQLFGPREQRDDLAVVDWAARVPHSTGDVGMIGASYPAASSVLTAGNERPGSPLKAIFPIVGPSDVYRDLVYPGGIFNSGFGLAYSLGLEIGLDTTAPAFGPVDPQSFLALEQSHLAGSQSIDVPWVSGLLADNDTRYDSSFWQQRQPSTQIARIASNRIATFEYNGWFDIWQRGDSRVYDELQNGLDGRPADAPMLPGQRVDPRFQEAIGPYTHAGTPSTVVGVAGVTSVGTRGPTTDQLALEWFDTWLKHRDTGMDRTSTPFHAYEVGGGRWIDAATWPLVGTRVTTYYLDGGRTGSAVSLNDGALSTRKPRLPGADALPWVPASSPCSRMTDQDLIQGPVKGYGDNASVPQDPCFFDDRTLQAHGLTYTTVPLARPLDIGGPIGVTLYATANTSETEWIATVDDVKPDGSSRPLATGDLLGSLRQTDPALSWTFDGKVIAPGHPYTHQSSLPVTPGAVTRYDIEIPPILARIAAGHRLRITINSSDTPYLLPSASALMALAGGVYAVQRSPWRRSSINVPLLDPSILTSSPTDWGACNTDCGP